MYLWIHTPNNCFCLFYQKCSFYQVCAAVHVFLLVFFILGHIRICTDPVCKKYKSDLFKRRSASKNFLNIIFQIPLTQCVTFNSQTLRARELKFRPPPRVTCHVSCVKWHMSHLACQMKSITYFFCDKMF